MKLDPLFYGPARLTKPTGWIATGAFVVGGLLLIWSAYIHFHLWQGGGYRHIATIGPLFIFQSIAALLIGLVVIALRRLWGALLGAGFALSTLVGFLLSVQVGLFGFQDTWSAPYAHLAFIIEIAATVVLIAAGAVCFVGPARTRLTRSPRPGLSSRA